MHAGHAVSVACALLPASSALKGALEILSSFSVNPVRHVYKGYVYARTTKLLGIKSTRAQECASIFVAVLHAWRKGLQRAERQGIRVFLLAAHSRRGIHGGRRRKSTKVRNWYKRRRLESRREAPRRFLRLLARLLAFSEHGSKYPANGLPLSHISLSRSLHLPLSAADETEIKFI